MLLENGDGCTTPKANGVNGCDDGSRSAAAMIVEDEEDEPDSSAATTEEGVIACAATSFSTAHYGEVTAITSDLPNFAIDFCDETTSPSRHEAFERNFERYQKLLDLYQEQPHLLDAVLDELIDRLLGYVRQSMFTENANPHPTLGLLLAHSSFRFLAHLIKVRGEKVSVRHLPHSVEDLLPVLSLVECNSGSNFKNCYPDTQYCLLLWLNMLCQNPFELRRFDSADCPASIVDRVQSVCDVYLNAKIFGKCQRAAALLLAHVLIRPDVKNDRLRPAIVSELEALRSVDEELKTSTESGPVISKCTLLANIFKLANRCDLLPVADETLDTLTRCRLDKADSLLRKVAVKLIQRVGLVYLKPRVAAWRYKRGNRSLAENLGNSATCSSYDSNAQWPTAASSGLDQNDKDDYESISEVSSERLAAILDRILKSLLDRDTVVRWSAAKGIGRLTARLPHSMAEDVIGSLLQLCFGAHESDSAWHGGCLALAELARRGNLLPNSLPKVMPIVLKALVFDRQMGQHSVGAHVRDAACYICWSFARAYDPAEIRPYVQQMASALLIVAIFDREIQVRRAASAAFQENVGRQGSFAHGIEIVTVVDYFAVGHRTKCFHELSVFVASFTEYTQTLVDHLLYVKLLHWEQNMRILSAEALGRLTHLVPKYAVDTIVPTLLKRVCEQNLFGKQGAMFGLAHVVPVLWSSADYRTLLEQGTLSMLGDLPGKIAPLCTVSSKYRGGELLRKGLNVFIANLATVQFPLSKEQLRSWNGVLDENLKYIKVAMRVEAGVAMARLWRYYRDQSETVLKKIESYQKLIENAGLERERCAGALALQSLPREIITMKVGTNSCTNVGRSVSNFLTSFATSLSPAEVSWAEARRDCVSAITALDDYTTTNHGDVGRFVREAAMIGLGGLIPSSAAQLGQRHLTEAASKFVQQSCEKIDHTRRVAAMVFSRLVNETQVPFPHRTLLQSVYPCGCADEIDWLSGRCFARSARLLSCDTYMYHALLGFVISAGGVTESTMRSASEALLSYVNEDIVQPCNRSHLDRFVDTLCRVFEEYKGVNRVIVPTLTVLDMLFTDGLFQTYEEQPDQSKSFANLVRHTLREGASAVKNQRKTKLVVQVLCDCMQLNTNSKLWNQATAFVLGALLNASFPTVRRWTSEQLYESLLTYGCLDNHTEIVMSLLSETEWDSGDLNQLAQVQTEIADRLGVQLTTG